MERLDKVCDRLELTCPYPNAHKIIRQKSRSVNNLLSEIDQLTNVKGDYEKARLKLDSLAYHIWRLIEALQDTEHVLRRAQPAEGTGSLETHQATVREIAIEVDELVMDATIRARFTAHIDRLCKMVEDYGQALQSYAKKLQEAEIRWKQSKSPLPLSEFCPPPAGWVETTYWDNQFIKVGFSVTHRPKEPVNPLLWFGIFGNASLQRKPEDNEKLMCTYVLLAIIHDYELRYSGTPIDSYIFSDDYKGKWFERDNFCEDVWKYYHYYNQYADLIHHPATANEKLPQLNRALEHVEHDLASTQKRPTTAEYLSGLLKHLEYLQAALQSKDQSLQLECHRRIEKYISPKEQFVDMLRQCQSEYRCHNEHTHNAIEIVVSGIRDGSFPYPALWMGLADARFISELKRWIEEAKSQPAGQKPTKTSGGETNLPDYRAVNLAKRTITIGAKPNPITSERVWDFLKDLCSAFRQDRIVPLIEGNVNNKNAVDQLRRLIGRDRLHSLVVFVKGGYKLNPEVKILDSGQIGIRKTHLKKARATHERFFKKILKFFCVFSPLKRAFSFPQFPARAIF